MGLLDSVIGGVVGQVLGGGRGSQSGSSGMSPLVKALLMLLLAKGMSGGLEDILGRAGGSRPHPDAAPDLGDPRGRHPDDGGDIGGFDQGPSRGGGADHGGFEQERSGSGGPYGDLAGMLDGPGGAPSGTDAPAQHGRQDEEPDLGGLDGLVERFQRGGLGDVIGSWIGQGDNRPVRPNQLADALGPDTIDTLERQTGLERATLLDQLAQVLPEVVNRLTPQGRAPSETDRRGW